MISQQLKSGTSGRREVEKRTCEEEKRIGHNTHGEAVSLLFMSGPRDPAAGNLARLLDSIHSGKDNTRQKLNLTPIMTIANITHLRFITVFVAVYSSIFLARIGPLRLHTLTSSGTSEPFWRIST